MVYIFFNQIIIYFIFRFTYLVECLNFDMIWIWPIDMN